MFVGHYAAAPLAAASGKIKLWHGFVAVQFVDFIWAIFILLGIEKVTVSPGITQANPLDLHFMPYTHSLLFTLGWSVIAALAFKAFTRAKGWSGAGLIGALVLSHWIGDVIVHTQDMTLWPGSEKIGFGLWNYLWLSLPFELGLTLGALAIYVAKTKPANSKSKFWIAAFVVFLIALELVNTFGGAPGSTVQLALSALFAFTVIAIAAARFERTRMVG